MMPARRYTVAHVSERQTPPAVEVGVDTEPPVTTDELTTPQTSLATARLYLVGVTVLWGTYTPVVRRLFMEEGAPDPTTLTLVRSVFAAAALLLASLWTPADSQPNGTDRSGGSLRSMDRAIWVAAAELGLWGTMGTLFMSYGLENTTALRASLLLGVINILVPFLTSLSGEPVGRLTWVAAVISVCGTAIITAEPSAASETMLAGIGVGDAAVLGAALCYALTTARLGVHSRKHDATPLAFGRMAAKVVFSAALVISLWYEGNVGGVKLPDHEAIEWVGWTEPYQWLLVLFTALVSEALSTALQGKGQAIVPASQAQPIFASTPMWTALWAFLIVGEPLYANECIGGAVIIGAVLLAGADSRNKAEAPE